MLHPNQFQVNEAWIAFQLNDAPIQAGADGNFNCVALMDAASCFILTSTLISADGTGQSKLEARRLLKNAHANKHEMPKTLFIPSEHDTVPAPVLEFSPLEFVGALDFGF